MNCGQFPHTKFAHMPTYKNSAIKAEKVRALTRFTLANESLDQSCFDYDLMGGGKVEMLRSMMPPTNSKCKFPFISHEIASRYTNQSSITVLMCKCLFSGDDNAWVEKISGLFHEANGYLTAD